MLREILEELLEAGSQPPRPAPPRSPTLLAEYQRLADDVAAAEQRLAEQKHRLDALREALRRAGVSPPASAQRITPEAVVRIIEAQPAQPRREGDPGGPAAGPPAGLARPDTAQGPGRRAAAGGSGRPAVPAGVAGSPAGSSAAAAQGEAVEVSEEAMAFESVGPAAIAAPAGARPRAVPGGLAGAQGAEAARAEAAPPAVQATAAGRAVGEPSAEEVLVGEIPEEASAGQPARGERPALAEDAGPPRRADDLDDLEMQVVRALETGRQALAELDRCAALAQELARAGAWQVVKGVVSQRSPEHARIDEARRAAAGAQALIKSFDRQVRGLRGRFGERIELAEVANLAADFARAIADPSRSQPPGRFASEAARAAYHDVRRLCARLQLQKCALRARRAAERRLGRRARGQSAVFSIQTGAE